MRGAVGIALALVLAQSATSELQTDEGQRIFFLVGGVATLTLVINASLAQTVLYALGLVDDNSEEIRIMQHYARKRIHRKVHHIIKDLSSQLPAHDEELVANFCRIVEVGALFPTENIPLNGVIPMRYENDDENEEENEDWDGLHTVRRRGEGDLETSAFRVETKSQENHKPRKLPSTRLAMGNTSVVGKSTSENEENEIEIAKIATSIQSEAALSPWELLVSGVSGMLGTTDLTPHLPPVTSIDVDMDMDMDTDINIGTQNFDNDTSKSYVEHGKFVTLTDLRDRGKDLNDISGIFSFTPEARTTYSMSPAR